MQFREERNAKIQKDGNKGNRGGRGGGGKSAKLLCLPSEKPLRPKCQANILAQRNKYDANIAETVQTQVALAKITFRYYI